MARFYVYTLARPSGKIFYVGKGTGNRVDQHEKEARKGCDCHKCRVIRKIWRGGGEVKKEILFRTNDEQEAYDYEAKIVDRIGLGLLANVVTGGGKGQMFDYDTPLDKTDERDHIRYLRSRLHSEREVQKELHYWRVRKLEILQMGWGNLRRQRRFDDAELLIPEIERLRIALGLATQQDMGLW